MAMFPLFPRFEWPVAWLIDLTMLNISHRFHTDVDFFDVAFGGNDGNLNFTRLFFRVEVLSSEILLNASS